MSILNRLEDVAVAKLSKRETIRLPYSQMADLVNEYFVKGADFLFLEKVLVAAKGGGFITQRNLDSVCGRYNLHVGSIKRGILFFGISKDVWILDNEMNKFYQLDKNMHWKKFFKAVKANIDMERINSMK